MDMIPKTAEEFIRSGIKNMGPDQAAKSSGDFSRILARQVGHNGNIRSGSEDRYPEEAKGTSDSRGQDSARADDSSPAEPARDAARKTPSAEGKSEGGQPGGNPQEAGMAGGQTWAGGILATLPGSNLGTLPVPGLNGAAAETVTTVDLSSRLAGRIAARYSDQGGVQTLTLRLDPAHLGKVDVTMVAKGDHLTIRLEAGNPEAETALRENLKDLSDAIGAKTGRFNLIEVKVQVKAESGAGGQNENENSEERQGRQNPRENQDQQGRSSSGDQGPDQAMNDPMESGRRTQEG